jgi:hypothetical protein
VHFHLTIHFMPIHRMKRDLLEERATNWQDPFPTYNSSTTIFLHIVALPHLISQDRAHNVIRLHWKYTKHGRHSHLFVPGWQSTSERPGEDNYTNPGLIARCVALGSHSTSPPSIKPIHPGVSLGWSFNFCTSSKQAWHQYFSKYLSS